MNESLPGRIFISYRRQETAWPAGRLYDVLVEHFPAEQVFKDVNDIEPGEDFIDRITAAVGSCDVLLALIGPRWLTIADEDGQRRLDNPEDYVRLEIEAALERRIRVIPILVDEAQMPRVTELPTALAPLVRRNAVEIDPLTFDTKRLIAAVDKTLAEEQARREAEEAEQQTRQETEERAREEAEQQAQREAEQQAQREADERAQREAEQQAQREADERAQREAEQQAQREADERAQREAEQQAQREADERARQKPGRRRRWLIPAAAILAVVLATAGYLIWRPWLLVGPGPAPPSAPPAGPPVAPTGLTGKVSGAKIALRWNDPPSGPPPVAHWRVLRDGAVLIQKVPVPQTTVRNEGFHTYTVVAVGKDGQVSAPSQGWQSSPAWQKLKTGLRESFNLAGAAAQNSEVWVAGGQDRNGKRDEVLIFNPQTKKWRAGPKLPQPISHAPLVSTGDKLYLLGGLTAEGNKSIPLATVYSLDAKTGDIWIKEADLPAPRYGGAAAWDGKRLIFAGGAATYELNTPRPAAADIWELRSGKWESIGAVLQPGRDRLAAATDGKGRIWFVGGAELRPPELRSSPPPRKMYDDVEVLRGSKISDSTPIRTEIQSAAAVWTPDAGTCLFGGNDGTLLPNHTARPVAKVQCLERTGWPDLPEARQNAGAAVIDSTVYVVGSRPCLPCLDGAGREPDIVLALRFR